MRLTVLAEHSRQGQTMAQTLFLVYGCDGGCREIFETLKDSFYFTWGQDFCDYRNLTFSDDFHAANNHSDHPMFETFIDEGQF